MQHSAVLLMYYIYIICFITICVCKYNYLSYWSFYIFISFTGGQLSRISNAKIFLDKNKQNCLIDELRNRKNVLSEQDDHLWNK